MGEMACYQEFCPCCGKIPPSHKTREDQLLESQGYHRRLLVLDNDGRRAEKTASAGGGSRGNHHGSGRVGNGNGTNHPDQIEILSEKTIPPKAADI